MEKYNTQKTKEEKLREADEIIKNRRLYEIGRALRIYKSLAPEKLEAVASNLFFSGLIDEAIEAYKLSGLSDKEIIDITKAATHGRHSDEILANIVERKLKGYKKR